MKPVVNKQKFLAHNQSDLAARLRDQGYSVCPWQDSPGAYYAPHSHSHDEFIVVAQGQITFTIDGVNYELGGGDELILPANTVHAALNSGSQPVKYFICTID